MQMHNITLLIPRMSCDCEPRTHDMHCVFSKYALHLIACISCDLQYALCCIRSSSNALLIARISCDCEAGSPSDHQGLLMVALTGQINQMAIVFDLSGKYGMVINMDFSSIFKDARMPPS